MLGKRKQSQKISGFIKFIFQAVGIVLVTIFYAFLSISILIITRNKNNFFRLCRQWSGFLLKISGVKVKVQGLENINLDIPYVIVSNHASLFDIPILVSSLPGNVAIIYKHELEKIPLFGWSLKISPYISVKRTEARNANASIEDAVNSISAGTSILVFAEGTRSKTGELQNFKRGAFLLASRSGKPVVPVTIIGSNKIMQKGELYFQSSVINIFINQQLPPLLIHDRKEELKMMDEVYNVIKKNLKSGGQI